LSRRRPAACNPRTAGDEEGDEEPQPQPQPQLPQQERAPAGQAGTRPSGPGGPGGPGAARDPSFRSHLASIAGIIASKEPCSPGASVPASPQGSARLEALLLAGRPGDGGSGRAPAADAQPLQLDVPSLLPGRQPGGGQGLEEEPDGAAQGLQQLLALERALGGMMSIRRVQPAAEQHAHALPAGRQAPQEPGPPAAGGAFRGAAQAGGGGAAPGRPAPGGSGPASPGGPLSPQRALAVRTLELGEGVGAPVPVPLKAQTRALLASLSQRHPHALLAPLRVAAQAPPAALSPP
jgi:hypothetical protein